MANQKKGESFDWVEFSQAMQEPEESFPEKLWRKTKQNPLVPLGEY